MENHIDIETAKLLKSKGFDIETDYIYYYYESDDDYCLEKLLIGDKYIDGKMLHAPTQAMALRWLREIKNKYIDFTTTDNGKGLSWQYEIVEGTRPFKVYVEASRKTEYLTYEECAEEAILYCLKKLI